MVYRIAGILVVLLGLLAVAAPRTLVERRIRHVPVDTVEVTEERVQMMRVGGLAFVGIGVAFLVGDYYGILS